MSMMTKGICPAMRRAGIKDPESKEGIDFCTNQCPYDRCIVFEESPLSPRKQKSIRVAETRRLLNEGYDIGEIANKLGVNLRTVRSYLG